MRSSAAIANVLWSGSNVPNYLRFRRALREPGAAQYRKLRGLIERNANSAFGKAHGFDTVRSYEEFTRRVPLSDYSTIEPWVVRIKKGEANVLSSERVTHLVPTSGSSGARKLIPFTKGLQREFNAAIAAWLTDLTRQFPSLLGGPAYWSITPALALQTVERAAIPIGFEADTSYLGGVRETLANAIMAVPSQTGRAKSLDAFRRRTLLYLLLCRELRLISVWHPSFLTLLLDALASHWEELVTEVEVGTDSTPSWPQRARELRAAGAHEPEALWPALRVVSCWGDGAAAFALQQLPRRFPHVFLQPKGLIATEAFVTLPFAGQYPVAVCSHFFEFMDDSGQVRTIEALQEGGEYEIVVSTAGGLWRYRLGDRVCVNGRLGKTPSLKFLGRGDSVSDRFGEKLSEQVVAEVLREVFNKDVPRFSLLAPDEDAEGCGYTLYVEGNVKAHWAEAIENGLNRNPHYAYCRGLQQLACLRIFLIHRGGYETFAKRQLEAGARLGEIKPVVLSRASGWSRIFCGAYLKREEKQPLVNER